MLFHNKEHFNWTSFRFCSSHSYCQDLRNMLFFFKGKPEFLSGMRVLCCLNPSDLNEVRHYRDPPDGVVKIMDAICLLFDRPLGWESMKQLLGQSSFFQVRQ